MNADIRISNNPFDLQLWNQRSRRSDPRVSSVQVRWTRTDERERNRVRSRIAALQVSRSILRIRWLRVVLMSGKPVMVLRMIVVVVDVGVQQGHRARRHNQRRDEQQRQQAIHDDEFMRRRRAGQNRCGTSLHPASPSPTIVPVGGQTALLDGAVSDTSVGATSVAYARG